MCHKLLYSRGDLGRFGPSSARFNPLHYYLAPFDATTCTSPKVFYCQVEVGGIVILLIQRFTPNPTNSNFRLARFGILLDLVILYQPSYACIEPVRGARSPAYCPLTHTPAFTAKVTSKKRRELTLSH